MVFVEKGWKGMGTPGSVNFPHCKIYLDTAISDNRMMEILIHEIVEIIKDRFTLVDLDHPALCSIEYGIFNVLKDNRALREALEMACRSTEGNLYEFSDFNEIQKTTKEDIGDFIEKISKKRSTKSKKKS